MGVQATVERRGRPGSRRQRAEPLLRPVAHRGLRARRRWRSSLPDVDASSSPPTVACSAASGVDPGTKLLLLDGPAGPAETGDLLDLGCGYGPIALTLARGRRAPRCGPST